MFYVSIHDIIRIRFNLIGIANHETKPTTFKALRAPFLHVKICNGMKLMLLLVAIVIMISCISNVTMIYCDIPRSSSIINRSNNTVSSAIEEVRNNITDGKENRK
jgi:hypothetical protein